MCHGHCIEVMDRTFGDIAKENFAFCEFNIQFAEDFWQTFPVVLGKSRYDMKEACVRSCYLFPAFKVIHLTESMRLTALRQDPAGDQKALEFPELLIEVGKQRVPGRPVDKSPLPCSTMVRSPVMN